MSSFSPASTRSKPHVCDVRCLADDIILKFVYFSHFMNLVEFMWKLAIICIHPRPLGRIEISCGDDKLPQAYRHSKRAQGIQTQMCERWPANQRNEYIHVNITKLHPKDVVGEVCNYKSVARWTLRLRYFEKRARCSSFVLLQSVYGKHCKVFARCSIMKDRDYRNAIRLCTPPFIV